MALRNVVLMTDAEREQRRENDEAAFHAVHAFIADGETRSRAITAAARSMKLKREDVIAGYWRHVRREGR